MNYEHSKTDIDMIVSKVTKVFDYLSEYAQKHEQSFHDLMSEQEYALFLAQNPTLSEIHVIDTIGSHHLPNATFIAEELKMTKGAISKLSAKLLKKDLIQADHLAGNQKSIYYSLTEKGQKLYEIHQKLHTIEYHKFTSILSSYTKTEAAIINQFLEDLLNKL